LAPSDVAEDGELEHAGAEEPAGDTHDVVVGHGVEAGGDLGHRDVAAVVDLVLGEPAHAAVARLEAELHAALHLRS
jgi:alpha-D-ribose 1-methylphosphonate 5-triphosphate synthase subunit PhnG